jgi:hypothetical protein
MLKDTACGSLTQSEHRNLLATILYPNHPQARHQITAKTRNKTTQPTGTFGSRITNEIIDDYDEFFPYSKQTLNLHATFYCWVMTAKLVRSESYIGILNEQSVSIKVFSVPRESQ